MQNTGEIRSHIRAVEQTRKITNAMYLVSSARMKKVMPHVDYNRRYFRRAQSAMQHILASGGEIEHPYLLDRGSENTTFIVIAGDKGMVGSYNEDVLKFAAQRIKAHPGCHVIAVGISATQYFRHEGIQTDVEIIGASQDPSLHHARRMTNDLFSLYDRKLTDRVYIIYTQFVSTVKWHPYIRRLLPLPSEEWTAQARPEEMIYHPSPQEMFNLLVPQYTIGIVFGALVNSYAAEHCARMNAMQSATRNADELIDRLRAQYNLARQAAITREITEITGAAQALEEGEEDEDADT